MYKLMTLLFLCLTLTLKAQDDIDSFKSFKTDKSQEYDGTQAVFKLSFLFPAIRAEMRLAEKFSLDLSGRIGFSFNSNATSIRSFVLPQPKIHLEPKWNYNIKRRHNQGKKTYKFSSNFLSLHTSLNLRISALTDYILIVGPTWGIQRTLGKVGYLKLKTGLGYFHNFNQAPGTYIPITPIVNVHLGIMI